MAALTVTRENLFYIGAAKQSGWGTSTAPTWFWRWRDGTDANPEAKITIEQEGDTSPFKNLAYKSSQYWNIKIVEVARPIVTGYALQALFGTGADAYSAPTKNTTFSASVAAGASTFSSAADLGNVGTLAINATPGYTSAVYEVVTVNLASRSGTGPYTYTLATSGTFLYAHSSGDTITSAAGHVLTRQTTTYDPYTIEAAFSQAGFGKAFRIQDCVCTSVKLTAERGKPVMLEHTWYGSFATIQASLATPTFENTSIIGQAGSPFMFYQVAASTWKIDNATTGNAGSIFKVDMTMKNSTAPDDLQNEYIYPVYFIPSNIDITGTLDVHFQTYAQYLETYYGSASATTGATDSYLVGTGQASTTFNTDSVNSLALALPYLNYTAAKLTPKLDAKPLTQNIAFTATRNAQNLIPVTMTLNNSWANQY